MKTNKNSLFRMIPKVDSLLQDSIIRQLTEQWKQSVVLHAIDDVLDQIRLDFSEQDHSPQSAATVVSTIPMQVKDRLHNLTRPSFRSVINATGVVVHTNLGRSPLSDAVIEHISRFAGGYMTLEFEMATGKRGNRDDGVRRLLSLLFPGHEAIVVNNNAAAILLAMNTLAADSQAIISRGRIIEIGDGFRINQIQEKSGASLKEVGTTNRTHLSDFEEAICEHTALLLSVHPSNYRVVGFTTDVSLDDLVKLGEKHEIPVIEDWGSGCIVDPEDLGIRNEESAETILRSKPDAICFSGDKLLGGPQAGIIVGKPDVVRKMRKNHLYRALRVDKLTLLALEETLRLYLQDRTGSIPTINMLRRTPEELETRARQLVERLGLPQITVAKMTSRVGGGAAPEVALPSYGLKIALPKGEAEKLKSRLRENDQPVITRVEDEAVLLDLRTVFVAEENLLLNALRNCLSA